MENIVELNKVSKSYWLGENKVNALKSIDLTLKTGEFTALVGASGSGKTTLLNLIGTLDYPDSGEIKIGSVNTSQFSEDQRADLRNEKIGFIFQSFNLIPVLTVEENVALPLAIKDLSSEEKERRVRESLQDVGLSEFSHHTPSKLSGGQRQRVAIARALVTQPQLILADEPTANLDSKTAHMIIDLLLDLNQKKRVTFLFCTHDEKLMGRVQRIVRIADGVIVE